MVESGLPGFLSTIDLRVALCPGNKMITRREETSRATHASLEKHKVEGRITKRIAEILR
jgi:hypothetical protein